MIKREARECCDQVQMPTFEEEVKEFQSPGPIKTVAGFIGSLVQHAVNGFPTVPEEVELQRLEQCKACEHKKRSRCLLCNCYIPEKIKWADQSCPAGKWVEYSNTSSTVPKSRD